MKKFELKKTQENGITIVAIIILIIIVLIFVCIIGLISNNTGRILNKSENKGQSIKNEALEVDKYMGNFESN